MKDTTPKEAIYLKRSAKLYKLYAGLILFSLFMSIVMRPVMSGYQELLDLCVGLPIFAMFVMAPVGLFYSWKSYKRKEGRSITRFKYFLGHLFFCLLVIAFVSIIVSDLSKLF